MFNMSYIGGEREREVVVEVGVVVGESRFPLVPQLSLWEVSLAQGKFYLKLFPLAFDTHKIFRTKNSFPHIKATLFSYLRSPIIRRR